MCLWHPLLVLPVVVCQSLGYSASSNGWFRFYSGTVHTVEHQQQRCCLINLCPAGGRTECSHCRYSGSGYCCSRSHYCSSCCYHSTCGHCTICHHSSYHSAHGHHTGNYCNRFHPTTGYRTPGCYCCNLHRDSSQGDIHHSRAQFCRSFLLDQPWVSHWCCCNLVSGTLTSRLSTD